VAVLDCFELEPVWASVVAARHERQTNKNASMQGTRTDLIEEVLFIAFSFLNIGRKKDSE
jgi:hypothetical protein